MPTRLRWGPCLLCTLGLVYPSTLLFAEQLAPYALDAACDRLSPPNKRAKDLFRVSHGLLKSPSRDSWISSPTTVALLRALLQLSDVDSRIACHASPGSTPRKASTLLAHLAHS